MAELARGVELFCCECSFPEEHSQPNHLNPAGAARLAAHAGCERLLLTHFYPSMEPERAKLEAAAIYRGTIEIARDGSRHPIGVQPAAGEPASRVDGPPAAQAPPTPQQTEP